MKRIATIALLLLALGFACQAATVTPEVSRKAAVNFWNTHRPEKTNSIAEETPQLITFSELPMLRIYAVGQTGFIIMSADDCVQPVLAYSFDSPASEELNPEVHFWLSGLNSQIEEAVALGYTSEDARKKWADLLNTPVPPVPVMLQDVPMLLSTRWDQGFPYNSLCPYDSMHYSRAVVGCVATAMAQIMKYWNHPSSGVGSHTYTHHSMSGSYSYGDLSADFENTTYIWSYMSDHLSQILGNDRHAVEQISLISYHCGIAVDMMYGPSATGGSGAYSECGYWTNTCAESAFRDNFKYSQHLHHENRHNFSDSAWLALIDSNLVHGRPMYYSGSDSTGGHAFVLDGSDLENRYHFNWGWSGSYDGFYTMDNLAPGAGGAGGNATYTFNRNQGAIFDIIPIHETFDSCTIYDTMCTGPEEYTFHSYSFPAQSDTLTAIWLDTVYTIHLTVMNTKILYMDPNGGTGGTTSMYFCPAGGLIAPETYSTRSGYDFIGWGFKRFGNDVIYAPGDTIWLYTSKTIYAQWRDTNNRPQPEGIDDVDNDMITMWPNPTMGEVAITLNLGANAQIIVIDAMGRVVRREDCPGHIGHVAKISLADLPDGVYTIQVKTSESVYNKRIIKQ